MRSPSSGSGFIINSFAKWLKDEKNTDTYMIATDINYDANETTKKLAEYYKVIYLQDCAIVIFLKRQV